MLLSHTGYEQTELGSVSAIVTDRHKRVECALQAGITWLLTIPQLAHIVPPLSRKNNKMLRNWQLKDWRLEVKKPHQYKMNTWCAYRQDTHEMTYLIQQKAPKLFHSCLSKLKSKLWPRWNIIWRTAKICWVANSCTDYFITWLTWVSASQLSFTGLHIPYTQGCHNIHALFHGILICFFFIPTANQALISSIIVLNSQLFLQLPLAPHREHGICSDVSSFSTFASYLYGTLATVE